MKRLSHLWHSRRAANTCWREPVNYCARILPPCGIPRRANICGLSIHCRRGHIFSRRENAGSYGRWLHSASVGCGKGDRETSFDSRLSCLCGCLLTQWAIAGDHQHRSSNPFMECRHGCLLEDLGGQLSKCPACLVLPRRVAFVRLANQDAGRCPDVNWPGGCHSRLGRADG